MTIGPAPMMRTLLMSVRLGTPALLHQLREAIEEIADVVGSWARLGVALEAERRPVGTGKTLQAAVEKRHVSGPQGGRQGRGIDGKTVVLAGDDHRSGIEILDRMIRAVVPELHLDGPGPGSESEQLMPEADAERGNSGVDDFADRPDRVIARLGIPRPVGKENAVGSQAGRP